MIILAQKIVTWPSYDVIGHVTSHVTKKTEFLKIHRMPVNYILLERGAKMQQNEV